MVDPGFHGGGCGGSRLGAQPMGEGARPPASRGDDRWALLTAKFFTPFSTDKTASRKGAGRARGSSRSERENRTARGAYNLRGPARSSQRTSSGPEFLPCQTSA